MIYVVIGSNFGDEGKGLATDYLAWKLNTSKTLVVRHNGGAQSGHTVETSGIREDHYDSKRHVFNELSSGSFRGADTFWASTYYPDLFKLTDELYRFYEVSGFVPRIFASRKTNITIIDDVFINMLLELSRGEERHGSCGMGIWEATLRTEAGYGISMEWISEHSEEELLNKLIDIRVNYVLPKLKEAGIDLHIDEDIYEMLSDYSILNSFASSVKENMNLVTLVDETKEFFLSYDNVIFENGQGLCLDAENKENAPHVTASRTGLTNPVSILGKLGLKIDEVLYITRTYITKHGAGPLANEDNMLLFQYEIDDGTNVFNVWQGDIRYGYFGSMDEITKRVQKDLEHLDYDVKKSLFITHLNETNNEMLFVNVKEDIMEPVNMPVEEYIDSALVGVFDKVYMSASRYAKDVVEKNI